MSILFPWRLAALLVAALLLAGPARAQTLPAADWAVACGSGPAIYPSGSSGPAYYGFGPTSLAVDTQGNSYVLGTFTGTVTIGSATLSATQAAPGISVPSDNYIAKLNAQGQYQWVVQLGDGQSVQVNKAAADNSGNLYLTGRFNSYSMQVGANGPVLYNSSNNAEGFVARFSGQTGQCQWARRFGGTDADVSQTVALSQTGDVYITGITGSAPADFGPFTLLAAPVYSYRGFLAKLSAAGTWLWAQQLGSNGEVEIDDILPDNQGNLFLSGNFSSPSVTLGTAVLTTASRCGGLRGYDVVIAKYTDAGGFVWAVQGNAAGNNAVYSSTTIYDGQGHLYTTGRFTGSQLQLGNFILPNASLQLPQPIPAPPVPCTDRYYTDAYVAQLDASTGAWQWAVRRGGQYDEQAASPALANTGQLLVGYTASGSASGATQAAATLNSSTGVWGTDYALSFPAGFVSDQLGRLYLFGSFTSANLTLGGQTVSGSGANRNTGIVARLGALPLATQSAVLANPDLQAWPTPGPGTSVWVQGATPGQAVDVLDMLGRRVGGGTMPASGPLRLSWAGAGLPAGVYVLRSGQLSCRWVVE